MVGSSGINSRLQVFFGLVESSGINSLLQAGVFGLGFVVCVVADLCGCQAQLVACSFLVFAADVAVACDGGGHQVVTEVGGQACGEQAFESIQQVVEQAGGEALMFMQAFKGFEGQLLVEQGQVVVIIE